LELPVNVTMPEIHFRLLVYAADFSGKYGNAKRLFYPICPRTGNASNNQYAKTVSCPVIMATPIAIIDKLAIC